MSACTLFFDIGNTSCKVGAAVGNAPIVSYTLPTDPRQTSDQLGLTLVSLLRHMELEPRDIAACVGSSVVPAMSRLLRQACQRFFGKRLLLTPEDLPIPLENRYARPHEVGADRLVGAYAARRLFADSPAIVSVDFGTATTFDCVRDNAYIGGLICPGVLSSAAALAAHTAKLPQVSLEVKDSLPVPGLSTATSLNHGFVFGFAAMAEGLCARLAESMGGKIFVVGTGGFAASIARVARCFDAVRPDLLLEGLRLIYTEHESASVG